MKSLVVYFSLTGHTERVAEALAAELGADIEPIRDLKKRYGMLGYLKSVREAVFKQLTAIQEVRTDLSQYNMVIVGTPVWCWSLASPVRAYMNQFSPEFNTVAFFCTEGGQGGQGVFEEMAKLCGKQPLDTLEITETDIKDGTDKAKLKTFIRNISQPTRKEMPSPALVE